MSIFIFTQINSFSFFDNFSFCLFVLFGFAQIQNVRSESETVIPKDSPTPTPTPEKTHNVVAAYYDVENFPTAELLLE